MSKEMQRLKEIEARKAELRKEVEGAEEVRLAEIKKEAEELTREENEIRSKMELGEMLQGTQVIGSEQKEENRAAEFARTGRMSMPMFAEGRALLVSGGKLAQAVKASSEIGELPGALSSILDDVEVIDATGTGSWDFPYKKTESAAAAVTEGNTIGGTAGTFDHVTISPATWGVLDEISNQVKKMSPANYMAAVQRNAYLALRKKAKGEITANILASNLLETRKGVTLDATYIRNLVLNFGGDEGVSGGTKLYINKADLATLGAVRGTNEKKAVFDIEFTDENNGIIRDGGTAVRFSINSSLTTGQQLYGQPKSVKMLMWGGYEVSTDDGGVYFQKNTMGVRGLQTAGADLAVWHGMQLIKQAST